MRDRETGFAFGESRCVCVCAQPILYYYAYTDNVCASKVYFNSQLVKANTNSELFSYNYKTSVWPD